MRNAALLKKLGAARGRITVRTAESSMAQTRRIPPNCDDHTNEHGKEKITSRQSKAAAYFPTPDLLSEDGYA